MSRGLLPLGPGLASATGRWAGGSEGGQVFIAISGGKPTQHGGCPHHWTSTTTNQTGNTPLLRATGGEWEEQVVVVVELNPETIALRPWAGLQGAFFAERRHSARTIITVFIPGTPLQTTRVQKRA